MVLSPSIASWWRWFNKIQGWERFHITTTICAGEAFHNISLFLLENTISTNWSTKSGRLIPISSDFINENGLDRVHCPSVGGDQSTCYDTDHSVRQSKSFSKMGCVLFFFLLYLF